MPKYRNKRCELDGFKFDSLMERNYYIDLKLRQRAGEIDSITIHPKWSITLAGRKICTVVLDFSFRDVKTGCKHYIDVKGMDTPVSRLKRKLLEAQECLIVEVVKSNVRRAA